MNEPTVSLPCPTCGKQGTIIASRSQLDGLLTCKECGAAAVIEWNDDACWLVAVDTGSLPV